MIFQKPRLRYSRNTWDCRTDTYPKVVGYGYSAKAAYADWQNLFVRYAICLMANGDL